MSYSLIGIPDEEFLRGDIPMTKQEIRILALAKAQIGPEDIVIDVGAGTGSLSVEAARLAVRGRVYAIEREPEGVALIRANAGKFATANLEVLEGLAPEAMQELPAADAVFVGGSGGHLRPILERIDELLKPGGRIVIMAVTIETLHEALNWAEHNLPYAVSACGIQVNRLRRAGSSHMFQALNQVYIIQCKKSETLQEGL